MLTTIEDLADKLETLNENTRELLYKLYLWDTVQDVETIPVTLRVPNAPFFQTFRIPTKKHAIGYISQQYNSIKTSNSTKSWGTYSSNPDLQKPVILTKGQSADIHFMNYNGPDVVGALKIQLQNAVESDTFEFVVTISTSFNGSDNELIQFYDTEGLKICALKNTTSSPVLDTQVPTQSRLPVTYKLSFKYVPDANLVNRWKLFDFYVMPTFKFDGVSSFRYESTFVDPTT